MKSFSKNLLHNDREDLEQGYDGIIEREDDCEVLPSCDREGKLLLGREKAVEKECQYNPTILTPYVGNNDAEDLKAFN